MIGDELHSNVKLFVIFGIPGAGKTTIANEVAQKLSRRTTSTTVSVSNDSSTEVTTSNNKQCIQILHLDLDDCVPDWMRTNFAQGIYPTIQQRNEFATSCCNYIDESIITKQAKTTVSTTTTTTVVLVSFSFVNEDLRINFRQHYTQKYIPMYWILIDTNEDEAQRRIEQRSNHFYKGKVEVVVSKSQQKVGNDNDNNESNTYTTSISNQHDDIKSNHHGNISNDHNSNSEWNFAPVTFPHTVMNGHNPIEITSSEIEDFIISTCNSS